MRQSKTTIRVQGFHLDRYGHVNNARYLEFLEMGRWDFIRDYLDMDLMNKRKWGFFVTNINIDYKMSATLDDLLLVETQVKEIGQVKNVMFQQIFMEKTAKLVAQAHITFAMMDLEKQKVLRVKGDVLDFLQRNGI